MKKIKSFEDACSVLSLDPATIIPDFSAFPESDRAAVVAHAKLVIIARALNGDWIPDWTDYDQLKYFPWFEMGSPSGSAFSFGDYVYWGSLSRVGSRLAYKSRELAQHASQQFLDLYKAYFVKSN